MAQHATVDALEAHAVPLHQASTKTETDCTAARTQPLPPRVRPRPDPLPCPYGSVQYALKSGGVMSPVSPSERGPSSDACQRLQPSQRPTRSRGRQRITGMPRTRHASNRRVHSSCFAVNTRSHNLYTTCRCASNNAGPYTQRGISSSNPFYVSMFSQQASSSSDPAERRNPAGVSQFHQPSSPPFAATRPLHVLSPHLACSVLGPGLLCSRTSPPPALPLPRCSARARPTAPPCCTITCTIMCAKLPQPPPRPRSSSVLPATPQTAACCAMPTWPPGLRCALCPAIFEPCHGPCVVPNDLQPCLHRGLPGAMLLFSRPPSAQSAAASGYLASSVAARNAATPFLPLVPEGLHPTSTPASRPPPPAP